MFRLLHLVYFEMLNVINLIESSGYCYCFGDEFQGCPRGQFSGKRCCVICQIQYTYDSEEVELIKYNPKDLLNYVLRLFNDLKIAIGFKSHIDYLWPDEFQFKLKDYLIGV